MHHKKSEAQIGLESSGVSSDFNPTPPSSLTHKHPHPSLHFHPTAPPSSPSSVRITINDDDQNRFDSFAINPASSFIPNYHQHPFLSNSVANTSRLYNSNPPTKFDLFYSRSQKFLTHFRHHLRHLRRRLRLHLRLILLLSLPFFYFLVSHPSSSFILDFLSAFAFSAALLFSLNLAIPRLPTIRMFLASLPIKISAKGHVSQAHVPVYWSIGSWRKAGKGLISGCYVQTYSNGDVYEGEIHKGKCNGSGVYYYYMAGRYEGDWVDEKYDGYGVETWARGSRYRGQCKQGLRNGFGMYRFYTGDVYAGEWSNGQCHGCGIHTCEDGSRYVGEFKWGVKHGLGHYHFRNGDRYGGEYFADKMHGFGVYYFANGHRYEGAWHEGRRQGLGMYTFRNGETQSGHWQNGILDVPSTHSNICPVSSVAVNHSKVLNAVQEARRAADKAHELPKVDERVNRAVAAANKAANAARVAAVKAVQKQLHHGRRRNSDDIPIPVSRAFAIDDDPQLTISNRLLP